MFRTATVLFLLAACGTGLGFFLSLGGFDQDNPDLGLALARQASSSAWPAVLFISWLFCCWRVGSMIVGDVYQWFTVRFVRRNGVADHICK